MPPITASSHSKARVSVRARAVRPTAAAALLSLTWLSGLFTVACRDTREDSNYCSACTSPEAAESPDGTVTGSQQETPSTPQTPGSGVKPAGSMTSSSGPGQAGNAAQTGSNAAASGGASATSGGASVPTAGTRGQQAGTAAVGGNQGNGGQNASDPDAGNGGNGPTSPTNPRDAGNNEPAPPEPTPDAGQTAPPLPCNGPCPNETPVCDESRGTPRCVQCTADDQLACTGDTSTCDVEQRKCVQCTPEDPRHCSGDAAVCNKDNRCVVCTSDLPTSCPPAQQLCDDERRCVECLPGRTEECPPDRTMCNDGKCVACMNDAQCLDPKQPRCDTATNSCVGCDGTSDCRDRFPGTPVCDAETKACVACSPTGETLCPVGQYCDRELYQCVLGAPKRRSCEACRTDNECAESPSIAACIESSQDSGRFCFVATVAAMSLCEPGYVAASAPGRPNIMYCMPSSSSSCPAINNTLSGKACMNPADCGRGGQCPPPDNICKLQCNSTADCPAPLYCDQRICRRS